MGQKQQLSLPAEIESIPLFLGFIERMSAVERLDEVTTYDLKLAIEEATAAIIEHGYPGMNPGSIIVSFQCGSRQVVVRITDFGHPFEWSEPPEPTPEEVLAGDEAEADLGMLFLYRSVDMITYETTTSSNTLTFVKKLQP